MNETKGTKFVKLFLEAQENFLTLTKSSSQIHRPRYPSLTQRYHSNSQKKPKHSGFFVQILAILPASIANISPRADGCCCCSDLIQKAHSFVKNRRQ
jgi:hypothetical protein